MKHYFKLTSISREDLSYLGYDTSRITDKEMERLAKYMVNDYMDQLYWTSMDVIAGDSMGFHKFGIGDRVTFSGQPKRGRIYKIVEEEGSKWILEGSDGVRFTVDTKKMRLFRSRYEY